MAQSLQFPVSPRGVPACRRVPRGGAARRITAQGASTVRDWPAIVADQPLRTCQVLRRAYFFFLATFFFATFFFATFFFAAIPNHLLGCDLFLWSPQLVAGTLLAAALGTARAAVRSSREPRLASLTSGKHVPFHNGGASPHKALKPLAYN